MSGGKRSLYALALIGLGVVALVVVNQESGEFVNQAPHISKKQAHKKANRTPALKSKSALMKEKIRLNPKHKEFEKTVLKEAVSQISNGVDVEKWMASFQMASRVYENGEFTQEQVYLDFVQHVEGVPVQDHVIHTMVMNTKTGYKLVMAEGELKEIPQIATKEILSQNESLEKARRATNEESVSPRVWKNKKIIRNIDGEYRTVREIQYRGNNQVAVIDAETGRVRVEDRSYSAGGIEGTVYGLGTQFFGINEDGNIEISPLRLPDLLMHVYEGEQANRMYLDQDGEFSIPRESARVRLDLTGRYFRVSDGSVRRQALSGTIEASDGPISVIFNKKDPTEARTAQINGYAHASLVRKYFVSKGFSKSQMNEVTPLRVNLNSTACNASYGGGGFRFYSAGSGCVNTAYDTVVYHEYGHFIDDVYGDIVNSALSEAWGDVIAVMLTEQPKVGQHFEGPGTALRSGTNLYKYDARFDCGRCFSPQDSRFDPHEVGKAFSGFVWKLKVNLSKTLSEEGSRKLLEELVLPSIKSNARSIPQAVKEIALRDDDDGNLSNGTRHWAAILSAAKTHGLDIYLK